MSPVVIEPIGVVESPWRDFHQPVDYQAESVVAIAEEWLDGLAGIEYYSHIHVLYHQHRRDEWRRFMHLPESGPILTTAIPGEPYRRGVFAVRTPARPSGIGSCVVELLGRERNRLRVRGLDALNGTPVLDVKVYVPRYDSFPLADAPLHWCFRNTMLTTSRLLRWDTMSVSLTLGLRAGQLALRELGASSGDRTAQVSGSSFFAQGVEGVTGCSVLRGTMTQVDDPESVADWWVRLESGDTAVTVRLHGRAYAGASDVLDAGDDCLFLPPDSSQPVVAAGNGRRKLTA
jgi:tRNA-Thr(GGU) m(6)t(6)A37 methyltransferase TsaA